MSIRSSRVRRGYWVGCVRGSGMRIRRLCSGDIELWLEGDVWIGLSCCLSYLPLSAFLFQFGILEGIRRDVSGRV